MMKKVIVFVILTVFSSNYSFAAQVAVVSGDTRNEAWAKETLNNSDLQTNIDANATEELDNLGTTAINTDLISDTDGTDSLGSTGVRWLKGWLDDLQLTNAPIVDALTASEIVATDGSKAFQSLDVATYPSLTELAHVKGVTGAIQTQLGTKAGIPANAIHVATGGGDYTDLSTAVAAASAGDTILLYPGTYTDTITYAVNNLSIIGMGNPANTILTQADANIVDFGSTTGGTLCNVSVTLSAPTTAIAAIQGTTGTFQVRLSKTSLACSENLVQADQPLVGYISGAGVLGFNLGTTKYEHSGTTTSGIKAPFKAGTGGVIKVFNQKTVDIDGSGSSSVTTIGIVAGTGYIVMEGCNIDVDDDTSTSTVGITYIGSATSVSTEFVNNIVHVHGADNDAYGGLALLGSFRSALNHIHVECSGSGTAYSFVESGAGVINSHMDDIIATGGYTGNINIVSSPADGDFCVSGTMTGNVTGALTGNADTVTNATLTTALTVDTGTVGITGNVANSSILTSAAGASSIEGANTGDDPANDTAYDATSWDNNTDSATKNAIRDKIETISASGDLLADGTIPLTAAWDVGAYIITALGFTSDVATGTAPFVVASTTEVTNLKSATVGTITGLAPDTATTAAAQANITSLGILTGLEVSGTSNFDDGVGNSPVSNWIDADNHYLAIAKKDAGEGTIENDEGAIHLLTSGDVNDYLKISTTTNVITLETQAGDDGDLVIKAGGGEITFDNENLTTTGKIGLTGTRVLEGWFTDMTVTNSIGGSITGTAAVATTVTAADESADTTCFPLFMTAATGNLGVKTDSQFTYNSNTGELTVAGFAGPINGTVGAMTPADGDFTALTATSFTTGASSTPKITTEDKDDAAGTGEISFESAETQDIVGSISVDVAGSKTTFIEVDGVTETVDVLKPLVLSGLLTLPAVADPTTDADGEIALDTDGWGSGYDAYEAFNGTASAYFVATTASDTPTDGQVAKWNTGGTITWEDDSTGSGSLGSNLASTTNDITTDNTIIQLVGNSEDLVLTFTANTLTMTSTTALDTVDFGIINLATDGLDLSSGSITSMAVGGLPDNTVDNGCMADDAIDSAEIATDAVIMDGIDADGNFTSLTGNWRTTGALQGQSVFNSYSSAQTLTYATNGGGVVHVTAACEITMWDGEAVNIGDFVTIWTSGANKLEIIPASGDHFVLFIGTVMTADYELDLPATAGNKVTLLCTADDTWTVFNETETCVDGGAAD